MGEHVRLSKSQLRRVAAAARRARSPQRTADASRAICGKLCRLAAFDVTQHLVAYAARPGEIDPSVVVAGAVARGMAVYFPRVVGDRLEFLAASPRTLEPGAHGVLEPTAGVQLAQSARDVVFLVPGLAFDTGGRRLGRGGGHYDRGLAAYPVALRVGLVADDDLAPLIPCDDWDQRMDAVVTEQRLLWPAVRPRAALKENHQ